MFFEITNSPVIFQTIMNNIFRNCKRIQLFFIASSGFYNKFVVFTTQSNPIQSLQYLMTIKNSAPSLQYYYFAATGFIIIALYFLPIQATFQVFPSKVPSHLVVIIFYLSQDCSTRLEWSVEVLIVVTTFRRPYSVLLGFF